MPYCAAVNCKNSSEKGFRVHAFPRDITRRRLWNQLAGRDDEPSIHLKLCEVHFTQDQYIPNERYGSILKPDAVPTIFDGQAEGDHNAAGREDEEQQTDWEYLLDSSSESEEENFHPEDIDAVIVDQGICQNAHHQLLEHLLQENQQQIQRLQEQIQHLEEQLNGVVNEKRQLQEQVRDLTSGMDRLQNNLNGFFAEDQMRKLQQRDSGRGIRWTAPTIKQALQIRIMTGIKGYEYLRTIVGYPLPSYRSLCRHLSSCSFLPGVENEIMSFLGKKIRAGDEFSENCYLSMDEMAIQKKIEFDKGLKKFVGFISPEMAATEEERSTVACKVLVFYVRGLTVKWKQVVAYFYVGSSLNEVKLWECICSIIRALHAEGLIVRGLASDMGPCNTRLWRYLGVHAMPGSIRNFVNHPVVAGQKFYFSADLAHLLKNLWTALVAQGINLPDELSEEHPDWNENLTVVMGHIAKLVELQEQPYDRGITLQHKLREYHISPAHLQKMRVKYAAEVFSRSTAVALETCAANEFIPQIDDQVLPTAWFLREVNSCFDILNDRRYGIDNGPNGERKIAELEDFSRLFGRITFELQGWKPVQTGFTLSIKTVLDLWTDLVQNGPFRYILPGRLTTDCVENLFSQVRGVANQHPGPSEVRNALRLLSVGQFFYVPRNSNYFDEDDSEYLIEFLKIRQTAPVVRDALRDEDFADPEVLTELQEQGLYKTAGWIAMKIVPLGCHICHELITSERPLEDSHSEWTTRLSKGGLTHPSRAILKVTQVAEMVFNSLKNTLLHMQNPVSTLHQEILENIDGDIQETLIADCGHDMLSLAIDKFISLRVHILADDRTRKIPQAIAHDGRACYMATAANHRR